MCESVRMYDVLVLDPDKLREARGHRTLEEIAAATDGVFVFQQISSYEKGRYRPKPEKLPILLKALGVEFSQVAKRVSAQSVSTG